MTGRDGLRPLGSSPRNRWHVGTDRVSLVRAPLPQRPVTIKDRDRAIAFDLAQTALIVVDMQNDFCHPDGWLGHIGVDVSSARKPIEPLRRLLPTLRSARRAGRLAELGQSPGSAEPQSRTPARLQSGRASASVSAIRCRSPAPRCLEAGSWAAAVVDELVPDPSDIQVAKYRMSGFPDTPLDSILRNLRVTTLLFAGVNLDQCVLCTLQDANFRGYDCLLARRLRRHDVAGLLHGRDALQHPPVLRLRDRRTGTHEADLTAR